MRLLKYLIAFCLFCSPALADSQGSATGGTRGTQSTLMGCQFQSSPGTLTNGQQTGINCDSSGKMNVTILGQGVTGTNTASTVTTHLTFQTLFAASTTRKACTIANNGTDTLLVFVGATGSATQGGSEKVSPGGSWTCDNGTTIEQANIAITSLTTDGATFASRAE